MASVTKGRFTLNLGIVKLATELSDEDRQCAWELYTEIATRVAVSGKRGDEECQNFDGELLKESLDSLYKFFGECRLIMRQFPVGRIRDDNQQHLGCVIHDLLAKVLRPFLEKWQVAFRTWWDSEECKCMPLFDRQKEFPDYDEFIQEWSEVRQIVRSLEQTLIKEYKLVDLEPTAENVEPII